jgi:hypothetical protein
MVNSPLLIPPKFAPLCLKPDTFYRLLSFLPPLPILGKDNAKGTHAVFLRLEAGLGLKLT